MALKKNSFPEPKRKEVKGAAALAKKPKIEIKKSQFSPYQIIKFPLSTEKSIQQIEFDNKLAFVVDSRATKEQIKKAVEELFKVKVARINLQNSFRGEKRAYVRLARGFSASDVSADLGLI